MRQHNLRKRIDTPHHPGTVVPLSSATFVIEWEVYTRQTSLFAASRRLHPYDYTSLHNGHGKDKQRFRWHVHSPCATHTTVPRKDSICTTYCRTHPTQRTMTRSHLRVSRSRCQATNSGSGPKATIPSSTQGQCLLAEVNLCLQRGVAQRLARLPKRSTTAPENPTCE